MHLYKIFLSLHSPFLLLFLLIGISYGNSIIFDHSFIEDKVLGDVPDIVKFDRISDTPCVYKIWGIWNFKHPASEVAQVAIDFRHYTTFFHHVYRCDQVYKANNDEVQGTTWYVEGRAALARVWAIGRIDSLIWVDQNHFRFLAYQNEDPFLEAKWKYRKKGWLNFRTHDVHLAACIVATGEKTSRLGIVVQGRVREPMPNWLINLAIQIVFPQLLHDIDNEVERRAKVANKSSNDPWYKALFKKVF